MHIETKAGTVLCLNASFKSFKQTQQIALWDPASAKKLKCFSTSSSLVHFVLDKRSWKRSVRCTGRAPRRGWSLVNGVEFVFLSASTAPKLEL